MNEIKVDEVVLMAFFTNILDFEGSFIKFFYNGSKISKN
jgi:hypothetical protein